ncbi:MAG: DUF2029 domain-containing protein [Paludibacteraceae bacterium]|nr:DUF2029 domain-containing protein [Paludibacteraceae bacterium]
MNKAIEKFRSTWQNPTFVFFFGLAIAIAATAIEVFRGRAENFQVFYDSTRLFLQGVNPYTQDFVNQHGRYFLYTPVFSILFAPLALLPKSVAAFVWNIMNYSLFFLAIMKLPDKFASTKLKMFIYLLPILLESVFPFQFNITIAYIYLFAFILLEKDKPFWAVFMIMISATTKIYGIFELALLFCYKKPIRNYMYAIICACVLLILPSIVTGFSGLPTAYQQWWNILMQHNTAADATFTSFFYIVPFAQWLVPHTRIIQILSLTLLIVLFFAYNKRWADFTFRARILAILMAWTILFSDASEIHTYIIALTGFLIVYYTMPEPTLIDKILFWANLVLFSIFPSDILCPRIIYHITHDILTLDIYVFIITFVRMIQLTISQKENIDNSTN